MSKHPFKLLWSFVATLFLTGFMAGSQSLGLTRMNIPHMLGTMVTPDRDRARLLGFIMHFLNGWGFALLYMAAFDSWRRSGWWRGAGIGIVHALFVLMAGVPLLPGLHPRMAGEEHGPTPTPAGAPRLHGPELRSAHAHLGPAGAHHLRGHPGRVLPPRASRRIVTTNHSLRSLRQHWTVPNFWAVALRR